MNNNLTLSVTLTGDNRQLSGTLKDAQGDVREFSTTTERESKKAETALEKPGRQAGTVSEHLRGAQREARTFGTETAQGGRQATQALTQTSNEAQTTAGHLNQLKAVAVGVGVAFTTMGVRDFVTDTYAAVSGSQQLQASLKTVTGSIENASTAWDTLLGFAADTPFTLDQSVQGFIRMQSLGLNPTLEALRSYGNTSAAMGKDMMQMVEAVADATTGEFERLKEFGIRASKEGEQISFTFQGVTTTVANSANAISQYLQQIGENQFAGAMADQMDTLSGKASNLEDGIYQFYLAIGDAGATEVFESTLANASNTVQFLTDNIDTLASGAEVMAVLIGGRVVVALANATAAKLAATQQTIAYQLALARMAGVSGTAAAAQTALAGASRAAAGALTLVGGPVGAAMLAGGAIYYFREELGLVAPKVQSATDRVDDMTSALDANSEAALKNARAMLEAEQQFQQFRQATLAMDVSRQRQIVADEQKQWDAVGGQAAFGMGQRSESQQALHELQVELMNTRNAIDAAGGSVTEIDEKLAQLERTTRETITPTTDLGDASKTAAAHAKELAKSTQAQADALEDLYNRLRPGRRETVQLARDMQTLTLAIAMGTGNIAENIQMMGLLQQQFIEAQKDTDDLAAKTVDAAFTMEGAWDEVRLNGLRRLDDGFADLWEGAIDGSLNAGEIMKRGLNQTLAEMGQMAFTRPITVQFATSMGFGGNGAGGQQAGGSAQSFGGMPSFSGMMDGSGAIANAYRAFQGTGSTYAGTFGSELAVQTQGGLKAGFESFAASGVGNATLGLGGGFVGSKLGGSVFGESKEQQIGATVGGIAGQVLIPIPGVGAGIGSFLGSGLGSLFGSAPTKFSGRFGTTASLDRSEGAGKDGVFEHQADGRFYRETALGYAGFRDQGTERLQRAGVGEDKQWAEDLVNATAAMDALTVSVARSDEQVSTMRDTVQGLEVSGRNAGEIIEFALKGRALAALESIGYTFSDAVSSLPADEFTARLEIMAGGMGVLMQSTDRLNLNFDATAAGALEAAGNLAQIAGGVDNLAAIQQGYYQATFTETERLSRSQAELRESLSSVTDQVPTTVGELRALVEAQSLNDAATGELAVHLWELAPALKQTNDAVRDAIEQQYQESLGRAPETAGMDYWFNQVASGSATLERALSAIAASSEAAEYAANGAASGIDTMADALRAQEQLERQLLQAQGNTAAIRQLEIDRLRELETAEVNNLTSMQRRIWAIEDEKTAQQEAERAQQERNRAIEQEASAMARARDQLASFGVSITNYVDNLRSTDAGLGSPADQLAASSQAFYEQYDKAASGDRNAMNNITQYADRFIEAQKNWSASGSQTTATIDKVVGMLESLPDQVSVEQFLADEFRGIVADQTEALGDIFGNGFSNAVTSLSQNFDQIDSNLNGLLTFDEMKRALGDKATDAQLSALIAAVDTNGDGMISRQELTNARLGGLAKGVASSLEGSFNLLDTSLDGLLTYSELRQGLGGLATNAQVRAMMRGMDLNADGVISQLESVVIASMPTDAVLGTVLRNKMTEVGSRQLTHSQVRNALSPIATDAEISRLIREVDVNGDGMISQQELTNSRLGGLSHGIANAVAGEFDRIDLSADGLIDYNEFRKTFAGMATDSQLRRIFNQLDATRTGTISRLDAQTNELVTAAKSSDLSEQEQSIVRALNAQQNSDTVRWWGWNFANEFQRKFKPSVGEGIGVSLAPAQNGDGARSIAKAFKQILGANTNGSHATGLGYVPFDGYIAELHKGEMVATAEDAKVLRELAGGAAMSAPPMPAPRGLSAPTLPAFPLLDQRDQTQLMRDVLNENKRLRADINKLMSGTNKHLAAANTQRGAAAKGQIGAIERGNKMLKRMDDDKRLEAAKR